ncbi:ricin B lectin domain-containing protein [Butyriboletus roseoflavus]|nr:ricin B lectin domain-containing protein [Butyriboletus roseoflavus]
MSFIQANDIYSLTNVQGGTCIDLSAGDDVSGTFTLSHHSEPTSLHSPDMVSTVTGYEYHNGDNQAWIFESAGGDKTFFLKSKGINKYLSAAGEPSDEQKVIASESQYAWRVEDQSGVEGGVRLSPASNNNFCVDLSDNGNSTPGNPIQLWGRWAGQNQVWKVQKIQ